jgi:hypothetical protein
VYVKDLVGFMKHCVIDGGLPGTSLFNCTYEPTPTVEAICLAIKGATGIKRPTPLVPAWILMLAAVCAAPFGGRRLGLHPDRVKKLMVSTNVSGKRLAESGYVLKYTLESALADWLRDCGDEGLE